MEKQCEKRRGLRYPSGESKLIHVNVWQNQYSIVKQNKVKIKIRKKKKKKKYEKPSSNFKHLTFAKSW